MKERQAVKFEIVKRLGVIGSQENKFRKEANLISWGGRSEKLDIRGWSGDHEKMSHGVLLTMEEAKGLRDILNEMDLEEGWETR